MSVGPGLFGGWRRPADPGCGCSGVVMILAGALLVIAGVMRGCGM
jgi:hypothetical protein